MTPHKAKQRKTELALWLTFYLLLKFLYFKYDMAILKIHVSCLKHFHQNCVNILQVFWIFYFNIFNYVINSLGMKDFYIKHDLVVIYTNWDFFKGNKLLGIVFNRDILEMKRIFREIVSSLQYIYYIYDLKIKL